jgi:glycosyltransferase involved in cell wall biosynthesis
MKPLAICIPTYNRAPHLRALLDSVVQEVSANHARERVVVVVGDNHSEDDTAAVVGGFGRSGIEVIYRRHDRNMGFAHNLNFVVAKAPATYCWMMGSDDRLSPGSLARVLGEIGLIPDADVIIGNKVAAGRERRYLEGSNPPRAFHVQSEEDLLAYVTRCTEVSALFAFISTMVVRKDTWSCATLSDHEGRHAYTHCLRMFRILSRRGGLLRYANAPIVETGVVANEYSSAIHRHALLDACTLEYVSGLFSDRIRARRALARVFRRQYGTLVVGAAKAHAPPEVWAEALPLLTAGGYSRIAIKRSFLDAPVRVLWRAGRAAMRSVKKSSSQRPSGAGR